MRSSITFLVLLCAMPGAAFGQKNLTILNAFPGDQGPGTKVLPDNVGGVSDEHVVDFTSANFVVPPPGGRLRGDEARRTTCVYVHAGSVFTCNGAKRLLESRCGVFWCEVRVSDGAVLQEGFVDDDQCDYVIPTLAVDANGNVGLGCTRSSETEFPSAYVMVHGVNDKKGTMRPAVLAMKGTTAYSPKTDAPHGIPWGNYNSTCIDPKDGLIFWTSQQYAIYDVPGQWSTCWTAFKAD